MAFKENEPAPHENNEPAAIDSEQVSQLDELTNDQLGVSSETPDNQQEPNKEEKQQEPAKQEPEVKEPPVDNQQQQQVQQQQVQQQQQTPEEIDYKKKAEELQQTVDYFTQLAEITGTPQQGQQQQTVQQEQQVRQQQTQQQDIFDNIAITEDELIDLNSGSVERAAPVIRKFLRNAVAISMQQQQVYQQNMARAQQYINVVQGHFYSKEKYADLKDYPEVVEWAGNQLEAEMRRTGKYRYLHQCVDDIGKLARNKLTEIRGRNNNNGSSRNTPPVNVGSKQGVVGGVKQTPPPQEQLTEQQTEMYDLLN